MLDVDLPWDAESENFGLLRYQQITLFGCTAWTSQFIITKPVEFLVSCKTDDLL